MPRNTTHLPADRHAPLVGLTRHWPRALAYLWIPVLLLMTLRPVPAGTRIGPEPFDWCLICGSRGTADAILNIWLFLPLGVLAARRLGILRTTLVGLVLATGIELAQLGIAGRYSTLADIVWNGTGALLGAVLYGWLAGLAAGARPPRAVGLAFAFMVGAGTLFGGWALEPSPTDDVYWGQWTPFFGTGTRYPGTVLEARFNDHPFPSSRLPDTWSGPAMLRTDWTLTGTVVKGTPPSSFTSVLSIYDGTRREVLYFGAFGENLLLRERMRAQDFRLDQPEFMAVDALARVAVGDTMSIVARRSGDERCLTVDEHETCAPGFTAGRLWGLLAYPNHASSWFQRRADMVWLALLFFPLGLFAASWRHALLHVTVAGTLMTLAVALTRLVFGPWTEVLAAIGGAAAGLAAAGALRFLGGRQVSPTREPSLRASDAPT